MGRVVLVAGVSRYLGTRFARLLSADPAIARVIGIDVVPPSGDVGTTEFVRADIRNPVIAKVMTAESVDTVVHLNVLATPTGAGGRVAMKEINVIGSMQLLAACQNAPSVRRVVVKSTTAVYGASPRDPTSFTEDADARALPRTGWGKDSVEVEGYVRGFSRRRPDIAVSTLRLANVVGPGIRTPLTEYFTLPVLPGVFGFDPRLQLLHEDDALEALRLATLGSGVGVVNVAADGVILLSQAAALAGRPLVQVPSRLTGLLGQLLRRSGVSDFSPDQVRYFSFGRVVDTTRMRQVLGLQPKFTTREAFDDFVTARGLRGLLSADVLDQAQRRLLSAVQRLTPASGRSDD